MARKKSGSVRSRFKAGDRTSPDHDVSLLGFRNGSRPRRWPVPIDHQPEEVYHATEIRRRHALLSRSCPGGVGGILSEAHVKRGRRVVRGEKELFEKLGRNDPCPCGSGLLFKKCCRNTGRFRRGGAGPL